MQAPDWIASDTPPSDAADPMVSESSTYVMDPPELRTRLDALGLSEVKASQWLGIGDRTIRRWMAGTPPRSAARISATIEALMDTTDGWVDRLSTAAEVEVCHGGWRILSDGTALPESWWRAVVGRAAHRNPQLIVSWGD
ncbi:hypothetical protein OS125_11245 [Corynebacterium sp. P7003]|uniref:Helix-turn-helix transcriptional regulator n=1 Tax=Corynebacterium pygosceleis TaxID=2800406 RepID=A0ABT3WYB6_9CORY|nr:hypothetical protein [Corynebacterium pygosceleis]MCX7445807.1 hypothetical protein [Corynebacterium pygosceleis]